MQAASLARRVTQSFDQQGLARLLTAASTTTMKFRPCIDLHEGVVKQIVGSTLRTAEAGAAAPAAAPVTNFVAKKSAAEFASMYASDKLGGGHVIMLGGGNEEAAKSALRAFPGGLQVGGGITPANAREYLDAGASHIIVTSYVFRDGKVDFDRLQTLLDTVGRDHLVLDLSCRKRPAEGSTADAPKYEYVVVTDKWQKWTDFVVSADSLATLARYCDEFLVHGVDVEGMRAGIEDELVVLLGQHSPIPVTYAGGVRNMEDVERVRRLGNGRVDVSVGSALDIFGGNMPYSDLVHWSAGAASTGGSGSGSSSGSKAGGASAGASASTGGVRIEHNPKLRTFSVATPEGDEASLHYAVQQQADGTSIMDIRSTHVPDAFRGQGVAGKLALAAFEFAQSQGYRVKPTCSYISATFLPRNPQWQKIAV